MSFVIEDGTGEGYKAKVDSENRIVVLAEVNDLSSTSLKLGKAFISYVKSDPADTNNTCIGVFKYNGTHHAHISKLVFSTTSTNGKFELFVTPTSYSGGTSVTPFNLNRMSSNTSEMTVLSGASAITYSVPAANELFGVRLSINATSAFVYDLENALILGPGDELLLQGSVALATEKLRAAFYWYEADESMGM